MSLSSEANTCTRAVCVCAPPFLHFYFLRPPPRRDIPRPGLPAGGKPHQRRLRKRYAGFLLYMHYAFLSPFSTSFTGLASQFPVNVGKDLCSGKSISQADVKPSSPVSDLVRKIENGEIKSSVFIRHEARHPALFPRQASCRSEVFFFFLPRCVAPQETTPCRTASAIWTPWPGY